MFVALLLLSRSERPRERAPPVVGKINTKFRDLTHLNQRTVLREIKKKTKKKTQHCFAFSYRTNDCERRFKLGTLHNI